MFIRSGVTRGRGENWLSNQAEKWKIDLTQAGGLKNYDFIMKIRRSCKIEKSSSEENKNLIVLHGKMFDDPKMDPFMSAREMDDFRGISPYYNYYKSFH